MQRHTFFKGIPCIADENHLCSRRQQHLNTPSRAATHPFPRNFLCRERKTPFSGTFMQRHTFFKGIPCIADENHLCCRRQRHLNTPSRAATHPFPRNFLCRERKNIVFRNIHAATHLFQGNTLYRGRKPPLLQTEPLPNTPLRAATHHFPQNFLCRERGNVVFVKPPSR